MIRALIGWLTGGVLDRVLKTVDAKIAAETDREALKRDLIVEHYRQRADWMRAGGFWLMVMFAGPLAIWWAAVLLYSVLWCRIGIVEVAFGVVPFGGKEFGHGQTHIGISTPRNAGSSHWIIAGSPRPLPVNWIVPNCCANDNRYFRLNQTGPPFPVIGMVKVPSL